MALYIGTASASQDHKESRMTHAITQMAAAIALQKLRGGFPVSPSLDVSFLLPGKLEKAPFTGMQMGGYTDENRTLYFECAVPEPLINSTQAEAYVEAVIEDVVSNAAEYFSESGIHFDQLAWTRSLNELHGNA